MKLERNSFIRFAVAVALACYDLPADRAMAPDEAVRLVKWVIDMALGPVASSIQVEPMQGYPPCGKIPLIISIAGVQEHLCDTLSAMLSEIPVSCESVPA